MQKMTSLGKQKRLIEGGQGPRIKGIRAWNDRDGWSIKWRLEQVRHEGYPTRGRRGKPLNPLTEKGPHFQVDVNDRETAKKGGTERHVSTKLSHAYQTRRRKRTGRRALSGPREAYGWGKSLGPCHDRRRERERHDLSTRATASILRRQLFSSKFPVPIKTPKILSLEDGQSWATGSEQPHQRINQRPFELEPEAFSNRAYVSNAATMASSNV